MATKFPTILDIPCGTSAPIPYTPWRIVHPWLSRTIQCGHNRRSEPKVSENYYLSGKSIAVFFVENRKIENFAKYRDLWEESAKQSPSDFCGVSDGILAGLDPQLCPLQVADKLLPDGLRATKSLVAQMVLLTPRLGPTILKFSKLLKSHVYQPKMHNLCKKDLNKKINFQENFWSFNYVKQNKKIFWNLIYTSTKDVNTLSKVKWSGNAKCKWNKTLKFHPNLTSLFNRKWSPTDLRLMFWTDRLQEHIPNLHHRNLIDSKKYLNE